MEDLVELLVRWGLRPEEMVTDRFDISDAEQAYRLADGADGGKVSFTWE
jgi:threonine dehydrogenase-like Zn-dependent dehydrogenase